MKKLFLHLFRNVSITLLLATMSTALGILFRRWGLQESNVVVVYILSVLLTARFTQGYSWGIGATVLSLLTFNWFFTEPYYTLKVNDPAYPITFIIMSVTSIITSALTTKVKQAAEEARQKEAISNALYRLTNHLTDATDMNAIAGVTVKTVSEILGCCAGCVCYNEEGNPEPTFLQQKEDGTLIRRELEQREEFRLRMEKLHQAFDPGVDYYDWPIYGQNMILGAVRVPSATAVNITEEQTHILLAVLENAALAMERFRSLQVQAKSREEIEHERYRSNLLRAISHDIRTPLSGIMGAGEMLMNMTDKEDQRHDLAQNIYEDAHWLHSLVENILNLTKLQDGNLNLNKEPEAVEEVVGAAIQAMEKRAPGREILVDMPDSVLMVPMDARLIHQVLVNLMDNAVEHSTGEIEIRIQPKEKVVEFAVLDHGTGIPEKDLQKIFQLFYTTREKVSYLRRGVGLGLAICQTIVEAHGGHIYARNRTDGPGAEFIFTLPEGGTAA